MRMRLRAVAEAGRGGATDVGDGCGRDAWWVSSAAASVVGRSAEGVPSGSFGGRAWRWLVEYRARILAGLALLSIVVGGALHLAGEGAAGDLVWRVAVAVLAAGLAAHYATTARICRLVRACARLGGRAAPPGDEARHGVRRAQSLCSVSRRMETACATAARVACRIAMWVRRPWQLRGLEDGVHCRVGTRDGDGVRRALDPTVLCAWARSAM